jgi:hypothetical protein
VKIAIPTVHLNGSDGSVLQTQNEAALVAVELAIEQLAAAAPHGRDYYVQGDVDRPYAVAAAQHGARLKALSEIRDGLREIVRGIRRQNEARNIQKGR